MPSQHDDEFHISKFLIPNYANASQRARICVARNHWLPNASDQTVVEHDSEPARVPDDKQLAALVRFAATAPEQQRNNRLFWAACRMSGMVNSKYLGESEAERLLVAAAKHAGLPESEACKTTRSGLATGKAAG